MCCEKLTNNVIWLNLIWFDAIQRDLLRFDAIPGRVGPGTLLKVEIPGRVMTYEIFEPMVSLVKMLMLIC